MTLDKFTEILKTKTDNAEVSPEALLLDDLGLDSFRVMEIIYDYEQMGYTFAFGEGKPIETVKDLFNIMHLAGEESEH